MTNEQRVRVDRLERYLITDRGKTYTRVRVNDLDTALSLIKEQQEDIEKYKTLYERALADLVKADKQIELMAKYIVMHDLDIEENICIKSNRMKGCDKMALGECGDCIKQYFARKAKKE